MAFNNLISKTDYRKTVEIVLQVFIHSDLHLYKKVSTQMRRRVFTFNIEINSRFLYL